MAPYRVIPLLCSLPRVTLYTDASCETNALTASGFSARLCFLIFADEERKGMVLDVPDEILLMWGVRGHYILLAEALAPLLALYFFPQLFCGRLLVGFIDNLAVLSTLVSGSSTVVDPADVANEGPGQSYTLF